ncbi:MAG: ATP-binding cassette domain-containing protein [Candidatus Roizmanbacteria bacterium]
MERAHLLHKYGMHAYNYGARVSPVERALRLEGRNESLDILVAQDNMVFSSLPDDVQRFLHEAKPQITKNIANGILTVRDRLDNSLNTLTYAGLSILTLLRSIETPIALMPWEIWYVKDDQKKHGKEKPDPSILRTVDQLELASKYLANSIIPQNLLDDIIRLDPRFSRWKDEVLKVGQLAVLAPAKNLTEAGLGSFMNGFIFNADLSTPNQIIALIATQLLMQTPESMVAASGSIMHDISSLRRGLIAEMDTFQKEHNITTNMTDTLQQILMGAQAKVDRRMLSITLPITILGLSFGIATSEALRNGPLNGLMKGTITGTGMTLGLFSMSKLSEKYLIPFSHFFSEADAFLRQYIQKITPFLQNSGEIAVDERTIELNKELKNSIWLKNFYTRTFKDLLIKLGTLGTTGFLLLLNSNPNYASTIIAFHRYIASISSTVMDQSASIQAQIDTAKILSNKLESELQGIISASRLPIRESCTNILDPCIPPTHGDLYLEKVVIPPITPDGPNVYFNMGITIPQNSYLTVTGANGSGKTTFLYTLSGRYIGDNDRLRVGVSFSEEKRDLRTLDPKERQYMFPIIQKLRSRPISNTIGILLATYPNLIETNSQIIRAWSADISSNATLTQKIVTHCNNLGFRDVKNEWFNNNYILSAGQEKILEICIALSITNQDITVLLDEPFSHLSQENIVVLINILNNFSQHTRVKAILTANQFPAGAVLKGTFSVGEFDTVRREFEPNLNYGQVLSMRERPIQKAEALEQYLRAIQAGTLHFTGTFKQIIVDQLINLFYFGRYPRDISNLVWMVLKERLNNVTHQDNFNNELYRTFISETYTASMSLSKYIQLFTWTLQYSDSKQVIIDELFSNIRFITSLYDYLTFHLRNINPDNKGTIRRDQLTITELLNELKKSNKDIPQKVLELLSILE